MAKSKSRPKHLPLQPQITETLGRGQDNAVYRLGWGPKVPSGWVVKVNHDQTGNEKGVRMRHDDPREAAWRGVQYKKNKYEILRHFLGEHIPESAFIFTEAQQGSGRRYVEMTLQKELPRISLHQLTAEQRNDPRLKANMTDLVQRMQYMYRVLGEVNARTASDINLDAKLDLGGISDFVRSERLDHVFSEQELETILDSNTSPNLLVNPDNMQVYCIDFDQGQWVEGMSDAKRLAFEIDGHIQAERARRIGAVATS